MSSRLTEAAALARCDELGLAGRPRELTLIVLVTIGNRALDRGEASELAESLGLSQQTVWSALQKLGRATLTRREAEVEDRLRLQRAAQKIAENPLDAHADRSVLHKMGISRGKLAWVRTLRELMQNGEPSNPGNPYAFVKPSETLHIGDRARGTRLCLEDRAMVSAGTLFSPRFGELVER